VAKRSRAGRQLGVHYAGRAGDGEFAVVTIESRGGPDHHAHCIRPCPQCPWREDSPVGVFPAEAFRHSARTAYDMAQTTFGCHMAGRGRPLTCAGFLLRGAMHNLLIRLAQARGKIDLRDVSDGGFPIYASYRAMAIANGVPADDPALKPCRSNGYDD
jgi:hypothetical protein